MSSGTPVIVDEESPIHVMTSPFVRSAIGSATFNPDSCTAVEVDKNDQLYGLLLGYLSKNLAQVDSLAISTSGGSHLAHMPNIPGNNSRRKQQGPATESALGLGLFHFQFEGEQLHLLHQQIGQPVGGNCGVDMYRNVVLFVEGHHKGEVATRFCEKLVEEHRKTGQETFNLFRWSAKRQFWMLESKVANRPLDSVVLPKSLKDKVVSDIDEFISEEAKEFYFLHGVPYKRSYLLHGIPGAGKTSLIHALASTYHRNVYFLQPTHPEMTDDALRMAIQRTDDNAVVVLEDVDALFDMTRDKGSASQKSALTFSGLLNALDGVGSGRGQIFVLTTNFRERLDPALIRKGRVDLHIEFTYADEEQMKAMFGLFYPTSEDSLRDEFVNSLREHVLASLEGGKGLTTAVIQHYFVAQRKSTAREAVDNVKDILEDIRTFGQFGKLEEEEKKEDAPAAQKDATTPTPTTAPATTTAPANTSTSASMAMPPIHVHLHTGEK